MMKTSAVTFSARIGFLPYPYFNPTIEKLANARGGEVSVPMKGADVSRDRPIYSAGAGPCTLLGTMGDAETQVSHSSTTLLDKVVGSTTSLREAIGSFLSQQKKRPVMIISGGDPDCDADFPVRKELLALAREHRIRPVVFHTQRERSFATSMMIDPQKRICVLTSKPLPGELPLSPSKRSTAKLLYMNVVIPQHVTLMPPWQVKRTLGIA
jgi:hypothetical protein